MDLSRYRPLETRSNTRAWSVHAYTFPLPLVGERGACTSDTALFREYALRFSNNGRAHYSCILLGTFLGVGGAYMRSILYVYACVYALPSPHIRLTGVPCVQRVMCFVISRPMSLVRWSRCTSCVGARSHCPRASAALRRRAVVLAAAPA